jgi:heptosyltransferase-3
MADWDLRRLLVIQLGDIGDVVLSLPSLRALRERFPSAVIHLAVREKAAELLEDCPWTEAVIPVRKGTGTRANALCRHGRFFRRLRAFAPDAAVDMRTGQRGAILAFLSGARRRLGFYAYDGRLWRNRLFTHLVLPHRPRGTPMAEQMLSLLQAHGIDTPHRRPELTVSPGRRRMAERLLDGEGVSSRVPLVALQPFSLWPYKEWPEDRQARLADWLAAETGATVLLTGVEEERKRAGALAGRCRHPVVNLAGKTPLALLPALVSLCRLFVGMDSAGLHIAAAVDTPTLGLFGPSSSADWAPRGRRHAVAVADMACIPCREKGCAGSGRSRCMEALGVGPVQDRLADHLTAVYGRVMLPAGRRTG